MVIAGTYFDGESSVAVAAELVVETRSVTLRVDGALERLPFAEINVEARLGNTPRLVTWGGRARFVSDDSSGVDALARLLPRQDRLRIVAWLEARMAVAVTAAAVTFAAVAGFAVRGVPMIAEAVAFAVPDEVSAQLGESTMTTIDQLLASSELAPARQQELTTYFSEHGPVAIMAFRKGGRIGPNAFTLSATTVVMTDELVALAERDDELLAVYLHELGHARLRHVERSILQSSAWVVLFSVIAGDFSGAGELILSLPLAVGQMAYSRDFEREADRFAIDAMLARGIEPGALADILERMAGVAAAQEDEPQADGDTAPQVPGAPRDTVSNEQAEEAGEWAQSVLDYFSTHPATAERVAYIRSAAGRR